MLIIRNIHLSVFGSKLVPLDLWLKNGEIPQLLVPKLQMIIDNSANNHSSSTANNQPKGLMARYESFLSRRYPKVYAVHKMVTNGCKWCWSDVKIYYRLKKDLRTKTRQLSELKRSELEILLQTKEELLKLAVIVILIPLPFTIYIIALAVVFFPQLILTRHFWTNDQRKRFWSISLKRVARMHFDPLRKHLQNLDVNLQASLEELKKLELPEMDTYSLGHLYHLSKVHRVSLLIYGVRGFHNRAEMLRYLDHSLKSEDTTIDMMSEQQLCEQFYLRRLQYDGLSEEKMKCLLKNWIQHMTDPRLKTSLLLHVPVFEAALKNAAENLKPIQKC
ncbi:LETM1-like protein [Onchocerca flexuosa]|uniref:LETM1-like protein n=2 Tax=Onchocerca flexuosa TaxID=387005 RepID=A0A238BJ05_9BILA|nr:LETM1-like protein [Onchocerca flexuosa]